MNMPDPPPDSDHAAPGALPAGAWRLGLAAILLVAAGLRVWHLDQNGYDNAYYAAAVRSMAQSWHNFFYNAFDPAGFVSVDKPPLALWLQVASVKLFGFHWWSLLSPQVAEGVLSVGIVSHLVRRRFGTGAGLLAGLAMAVTPVSVAIDRSGNTDSCLVLALVLAAWALTRAAEAASRPFLLLSMAVIGLGFNVKMLAAFVVLPTFVLVYALGAPLPWRRRLLDLALAGGVVIAVALPWTLAYDLTPPEHRPFVGSSRQNSMVELAVGHNAIGRFVRPAGPVRAAGLDRSAGGESAPPAPSSAAVPAEAVPSSAAARLFVRAPAGPLRFGDGQLAGQVAWLLPLALAGLVLGTRQVPRRRPLDPAHLALILWSGWALTYGIVYSYAGGIFHFYYLATLAPPLAALAGVGVARLWRQYLDSEHLAVQDPRVPRLRSVPCVGPVTAAFLAAIDDVERFHDAHQLEAYLGLVPREYSSGERQRRGPITKAGHSRVRWLLIQAAVSLLRRHPPQAEELRTWALRIAARRGKQVAVVALARRLAGILDALLRDGSVFEPQHVRPPRPTAAALVDV